MFIGIDFGTSEVKTLLMNENGQIEASCGVPLSVSRPQPMWSEQNPADWWQAMRASLAKLSEQSPIAYKQARAIGLSGQMHGAVLLDKHGQVLRPAILWNDVRSFDECEELARSIPNFLDITGNLAMPGFTAPKILWLKKHEPELYARIDKVLLPKDYIRYCMTGEAVSDMSDAAGTLWLDVAKRDWSDELLGACGLTRANMPRLVEGNQPSAQLSPAVASELGLSARIIVAGGGGDNATSAVGIGAVNDGDGFISLGTSGVMFVVNERYSPNPNDAVHAFCHALPNRWHQMTVMLSAASALRWFCKTVNLHETELLSDIEHTVDLSAAPIFLPYLSGERTPHNDPHAQGVFFGLSHDCTQAHMGYAVLEGVAFGLLDGLNALRAAGTTVSELSLVGGGARSAYWAQLLADVLQVTIHTHVGGEAGGALGAARLGAMAAGCSEAQMCQKPPIANTYKHRSRSDGLLARYDKYKKIYQALYPLFK
ncbi:xylulokinase [Hydromonas duriensis]|uniref:Xylulose kinase n=1 Tax=Hydromonas duriensis TaxID=1527608 RepID=A0A4R6YAW4_9BURK|nr:xylulokinase [Hydromonas duriensis]TDR32741.1 xylulokinase [Hydromonas duriensis]